MRVGSGTGRHRGLLLSLAAAAWGCGEGADITRLVAPQLADKKGESLPPWPDTFATSSDKQALILGCIERFVPHAERFFRVSDLVEPESGWYDAVGSGVTQPRGAGNLAFAWATLLEARPEQPSFGGVERATLLDHAIQAIRHEALTSSLAGHGYDRWGNGSWQASLETFSWAFAAWRLWPELDADTRALVRSVVAGEASILIDKPLASGEEGDTGAEDNAWNAKTPALAAVMFPDDPRVPAWREATIRLALNAVSTAADARSEEIVDGSPLAGRMGSVNLHPDLTLENHGFFNPIYQQVTHIDVSGAALAYALAGHELPEALFFRTLPIWSEILEPLATDEGDFAMVAGQDWTSKDFQHVEYLGLLATRFGRADAAALEGRALGLVARRQALSPSGALLGQPELGYETMLVERLAALWWHHQIFGPAPVPTREQLRASFEPRGARRYTHSDFVAMRARDAFVSMSWDPARPLALVIPRATAYPDDPLFSYYEPGNLLGGADLAGASLGAWSFEPGTGDAGGFATAGTIGARRVSLVTFDDGVTALLDRGEGPAFNYALEDIAGLTGPRPIATERGADASRAAGDAGAAALGELSGSWANVAERLGLIVRGGSGLRLERATTDAGHRVLVGSADTGSGNRGAWLLPLVSSAETAALEPSAEQPDAGERWAALSGLAPDGSVRLALARWGGFPAAELELGDPRGAPVPAYPAELADDHARFVARLPAPGARGMVARFFVRSAGRLSAEQLDVGRARLRNVEARPLTVRALHVDDEGQTAALERTLRPAQEGELVTRAGRLRFEVSPAEPFALWVEPASRAHPGELARLRVAVRNAGSAPSRAGSIQLGGPEGWPSQRASVPSLAPDGAEVLELELRVPAGATGDVPLEVSLQSAGEPTVVARTLLAIEPLLDLEPLPASVPLARGGTNRARWAIRNATQRAIELDVELRTPEGVTAEPSATHLSLGPSSSAELEALVVNTRQAAGSAPLVLLASTPAGVVQALDVQLAFSEDLAWNATAAPFPAASAGSEQSAYPAALAIDGDPATFWVSAGTSSGQGPSPERPEYLAVDLGFEARLDGVVMSPRPGYGPSAYGVEVSSDGRLWREVRVEPSAADAVVRSAFEAVAARYLRLVITGSHDWMQPPRNVQVATLEVHAAP